MRALTLILSVCACAFGDAFAGNTFSRPDEDDSFLPRALSALASFFMPEGQPLFVPISFSKPEKGPESLKVLSTRKTATWLSQPSQDMAAHPLWALLSNVHHHAGLCAFENIVIRSSHPKFAPVARHMGFPWPQKPCLRALPLFTSLITLDLSNQNLTHTLPLVMGLTQLEELRLSGAKLGQNGAMLCGLTGLRSLNLDYGNAAPFLGALTTLANLKHLSLFQNFLGTRLTPLGLFTSLTSLQLGSNEIGPNVNSLLPLTSLQTLGISNNNLGPHGFALSALTNLTSLNAAFNELPDGILPLCTLEKLRTLNLACNAIPTSVHHVSNLSSLTHLELNLTHLPANINFLQSLSGLTKLGLASNVNVRDLTALHNHTQLRTLTLKGTHIWEDLDQLNPLLPHLRILSLDAPHTPEREACLASIRACYPHLTISKKLLRAND